MAPDPVSLEVIATAPVTLEGTVRDSLTYGILAGKSDVKRHLAARLDRHMGDTND